MPVLCGARNGIASTACVPRAATGVSQRCAPPMPAPWPDQPPRRPGAYCAGRSVPPPRTASDDTGRDVTWISKEQFFFRSRPRPVNGPCAREDLGTRLGRLSGGPCNIVDALKRQRPVEGRLARRRDGCAARKAPGAAVRGLFANRTPPPGRVSAGPLRVAEPFRSRSRWISRYDLYYRRASSDLNERVRQLSAGKVAVTVRPRIVGCTWRAPQALSPQVAVRPDLSVGGLSYTRAGPGGQGRVS